VHADVVVVANPTSGRGKGARFIPKVDALLRSLGVNHRMAICAGPEDPERLACQAAEGGAAIVTALGGDGQVGQCVNGLIGTESALAVIPTGTGNDFARHLGLDPKNPLKATELLASPVTRSIDVVRVKTAGPERHFINVGGTGFDSEVNERANRITWPKGRSKYVYSVFATLARFSPGRFRVTVDGREHFLPGMMIAVGNGASYGGGMKVTPEARSDDGILDLCVIGEVSKFEFVKTFPKVFSGKHVTHPKVTMLRGREIDISAERPFEVYGDGERLGSLPATFTVVPGALRVVVPAPIPRHFAPTE
jgi:diacylglycerol kinase (ATP)